MTIIDKTTGTHINYPSIKKIIIYGNGKKLFNLDNGYFEEYAESNGKYSSVYDGRIDTITLSVKPKNALKENLNRTDNYLLKYTGQYSFENGHTLYIHESEISVTDDGEKLAIEHNGEKNYIHAFTLHFKYGVTMTRCKYEKIPCEEKWTLPNNKQWTWGDGYGRDYEHAKVQTYDLTETLIRFNKSIENAKGIIVRWVETETVYNVPTAEKYYCRTEKDSERKYREKIAEIINSVTNKHISHYDVEKLLNVLDIKIKENK